MLVNEQDNVKHVLEQARTKLFKESFSVDYRVVCVMSRKDVFRVVHFGSTFGDSEHKRQPWDAEVGTGALI